MAKSSLFEPYFVNKLALLFEERVSFNRLLGMRITSLEAEEVSGTLEMRPEFVGHFTQQRIHGGVISAMLDAMGGLAVMAAIAARHMDEPIDARLSRLSKLAAIDLRVDYLRPSTGPNFTAVARVLRLGSRVASTRMEFIDSNGKLLSTGAAAYLFA